MPNQDNYQEEILYENQIKEIVKLAVKEAKEDKKGLSNSKLLRDINQNRAVEVELEGGRYLQEFESQIGDLIVAHRIKLGDLEEEDNPDVTAPDYLYLLQKHKKKETNDE